MIILFIFSDLKNLKLLSYHNFFQIPCKRWLDLIKTKLEIQIEKLGEAERVRIY